MHNKSVLGSVVLQNHDEDELKQQKGKEKNVSTLISIVNFMVSERATKCF